MRVVTEALGAMRDSAQPLTHLEIAVVEMASLEPGVRLAEILEQLGALKTGGPTEDGSSGSGGRKTTAAAKTSTPARKRPASRPVGKTAVDTPPAGDRTPAPVPSNEPPSFEMASGAPPLSEVALEVATAVAEPEPEADGEWQEVVRRVKERKLMVGVFLEESRRVGWEGAVLKLVADEVHRSLLEAPENRELLAKILSDVYERTVRVQFVDGPARVSPGAVETNGGEDGEETNGRPEAETARPVEEANMGSSGAQPTRERRSAEPRTDMPAPTVSAEVEQAMVWFEGEIVQQSEPGGPGR
jgi:hypothetical protein